MNNKRGRKPIKPSIQRLIFSKALKDKGMPRLALAVELKNLIEEMGEISPAEETMIRLISKARNHPASPLDKPWSISCLPQYPIPPEALPSVLQVWVYMREENMVFTIREALWAARIYTITKDIRTLSIYSFGISDLEKMNEISGSEITFADFDLSLFEFITGQKITPERRKMILQVNKDEWPERAIIEEKIEKYGLDELFNGLYTWEEVKGKIKEVKDEGSHNKEG
jgi:hypothetical protein